MDQAFQTNPLIAKILTGKATIHLDILDKSRNVFQTIKLLLQLTQNELKNNVVKYDKRLTIQITDKGPYECEFRIASDTLIFILHSNIFIFEQDHPLWKTSYLHKDPINAHCGMISVYNFLSDSFIYNRNNDIGYLVARIFINKDNHFYVEGKKQLGFLYNDYENSIATEDKLKAILDSTILYCLDFDMYVPPFDDVGQITVQEIINANLASSVITGKRLGFRFQSDSERTE